jgi:hypothetical protein
MRYPVKEFAAYYSRVRAHRRSGDVPLYPVETIGAGGAVLYEKRAGRFLRRST